MTRCTACGAAHLRRAKLCASCSRRHERAQAAKRTGARPFANLRKCRQCAGTGQMLIRFDGGGGKRVPCSTCLGCGRCSPAAAERCEFGRRLRRSRYNTQAVAGTRSFGEMARRLAVDVVAYSRLEAGFG